MTSCRLTNITKQLFIFIFLCSSGFLFAQEKEVKERDHGLRFEQLGSMLPSPNQYRGIDGAPGPEYWQQRADYEIACTLDVEKNQLFGQEKITYFNQSPNTLRYIWLQLDENEHNAKVDKHYMNPSQIRDNMSEDALRYLEPWRELEKYGCNIETVKDAAGKDMKYTINKTMMRVDLAQALKPGEKVELNIGWNY